MSKKHRVLIATLSVFLTTATLSADFVWAYNKDLANNTGQRAYGIRLILYGNWNVTRPQEGLNYNAYLGGTYNFDFWFAGPSYNRKTILYWSDLSSGTGLPSDNTTRTFYWHIGPASYHAQIPICDMYWTDVGGNRLDNQNVIWNASIDPTMVIPSEVTFKLTNLYQPWNLETDTIITDEWAALRDIFVSEIKYAINDTSIPLDSLNSYNEYLDSLLSPLADSATIHPRDSVLFEIPAPAEQGQYIVVRWHNIAPSIAGSDSTDVIDWFEFQVDTTTAIEELGKASSTITLEVKPAFGGLTDVHYFLPQAGVVDVAVYSVIGERVSTLVNSYQSAGSHTVSWDGVDGRNNTVAPGVYFCRLSAGGVRVSEKMIRLR